MEDERWLKEGGFFLVGQWILEWASAPTTDRLDDSTLVYGIQ